MPLILCTIKDGTRDSECLAEVKDFCGKRFDIFVERDFLVEKGGKTYLPLYDVGRLSDSAVLLQFPHETVQGQRRMVAAINKLTELEG